MKRAARSGPRPGAGPRPSLKTLRRLEVWGAGAAVAVVLGFLTVADLFGPMSLGVHLASRVLAVVSLAVGAWGLAGHVFRVIEDRERDLLERNRELAALEERFRTLIEHSADGIGLLDARGTVLYVSPAAERITGVDVHGRRGFDLLHPEDRARVMERYAALAEQPGGVITEEFRIAAVDGGWRWVESVASNYLGTPGIRAVVVNYRDVTDRKEAAEGLRRAHEEMESRVRERTAELVVANEALWGSLAEQTAAERRLRESQQRLASVIGTAFDAIVATDHEGRIVLFNAAAEAMFRRTAAQTVGQPIAVLVPERYRAAHVEHVRRFGESGVATRRSQPGRFMTGLRADGEEFPAEVAISRAEVEGRRLYTAILRDVTERLAAEEMLRRSNERLRGLAGRLETVREEERALIAREVHDELGQALTGLKIDLSRLTGRLPAGRGDLREQAAALGATIEATIDTVRRISSELRPGVLDDLGLEAAVEWQVGEFQERTGIACELTERSVDSGVAPAVATGLFRILQEALTNVVRHAGATRVEVRLRADPGQVVLEVQDDGRGITAGEVQAPRSLGLLGMQERALALGGTAAVVGSPGRGTIVTVRVPQGAGGEAGRPLPAWGGEVGC